MLEKIIPNKKLYCEIKKQPPQPKIKRILTLLKKIYNNPLNFVKFSFILVYRKLRNTFVYFIN